jgi:hypothetical protein
LKKKLSQKRAGGVAQGIGPEFKPQYRKKKKKKPEWYAFNKGSRTIGRYILPKYSS